MQRDAVVVVVIGVNIKGAFALYALKHNKLCRMYKKTMRSSRRGQVLYPSVGRGKALTSATFVMGIHPTPF